LHVHTTHSDGTYSPAQVIELSRLSGLIALAITDHDTVSGIAPARLVAGSSLEIVPAVEISAEFLGREFHLLGYFIRMDDAQLLAGLKRLCEERTGRFWDMVERLRSSGIAIDEDELREHRGVEVLGRRHLADVLVKSGCAGSVREAFDRYLSDDGRVVVPKVRLPVAEAIRLVRGAGGVASWAHPSYDCTEENLATLRDLGMEAVEVSHPGRRPGRERQRRSIVAGLGLSVTGGSDCHGPEPARRALGARSVSRAELELLRQKAAG